MKTLSDWKTPLLPLDPGSRKSCENLKDLTGRVLWGWSGGHEDPELGEELWELDMDPPSIQFFAGPEVSGDGRGFISDSFFCDDALEKGFAGVGGVWIGTSESEHEIDRGELQAASGRSYTYAQVKELVCERMTALGAIYIDEDREAGEPVVQPLSPDEEAILREGGFENCPWFRKENALPPDATVLLRDGSEKEVSALVPGDELRMALPDGTLSFGTVCTGKSRDMLEESVGVADLLAVGTLVFHPGTPEEYELPGAEFRLPAETGMDLVGGTVKPFSWLAVGDEFTLPELDGYVLVTRIGLGSEPSPVPEAALYANTENPQNTSDATESAKPE